MNKLSGSVIWDSEPTGSKMKLRNSKDSDNTHKPIQDVDTHMQDIDHSYCKLEPSTTAAASKPRTPEDNPNRKPRICGIPRKREYLSAQYSGKSRRKGSRRKYTFPFKNELYKQAIIKASADSNQLYKPVRVIKRLEHERFQRVVVENKLGLYEVPGPSREPGNAIILRPKKAKPVEKIIPSFDCEESNFILEKNKTEQLLSEAIREHNKLGLNHDFDVEFANIQPRGTGFIRSSIKCKICEFETKSKPLYAEIERQPNQRRGPRTAAGNVRALASIQNTPAGISHYRQLAGALGLKPIASSRAQTISNYVGEQTVEANKKDMRFWAEDTVEVLKERGVDPALVKKIDVAMDGVYENVGMKSSVTPGTAATAAAGIVCEVMTPQSKVLGHCHVSKRYSTGTKLEYETGHDAKCVTAEKHAGRCEASIPKDSSISERLYG